MFGECGRKSFQRCSGLWYWWWSFTNEAQPAPDYAALLAATDRSDADREADKRRNRRPFWPSQMCAPA